MSFFNIKDPDERNAKIEDYLALKKRLKDRNMMERIEILSHQRNLEDNFEPVLASNEKMTRNIVKELIPITEEIQNVNRNIDNMNQIKEEHRPIIGAKRRLIKKPYGPHAEYFLQRYMDPQKDLVDSTFGIRYENGIPMIGNKVIEIRGDDIIIDNEIYEGTSGLWSLITDKNPKKYDHQDLERYKELLYETSALHQHYDSENIYPRASGSKKWNKILGPIWMEFKSRGILTNSEDDHDSDDTLTGSDNGEDNDKFFDASNKMFPSGNGCRLYLQKDGHCFNVHKNGREISFTSRPQISGVNGNGLYLRTGKTVYNGEGLLLGPNSPFKGIPIISWLL